MGILVEAALRKVSIDDLPKRRVTSSVFSLEKICELNLYSRQLNEKLRESKSDNTVQMRMDLE